jgi:tetratricopeptide (TPR) repeat protein
MKKLEAPDSFHLSAAVGWIELGNLPEAALELEQIAPEWQEHFTVLEVRWRLSAEQRAWSTALQVAEAMVKAAPDRPEGWLHRAYAVRRAPGGGLEAAWAILSSAAEKFPRQELMAFNLACYACQLGRREEAIDWLKRAFQLGPKEEFKAMALQDEDLQPLWPEIEQM